MTTAPGGRGGGLGAAFVAASREGRRSLLRNHGGGHAAVSNLELFFDLVYVFAVTQLSHLLLHDQTWLGALETAVLFFAVWWAWMYTTWATNWIDPDRALNRLVIGAVMVASLVMACALPDAFAGGGVQFVGGYVAVQLGRTLYTSYAMGEWRGENNSNLLRASIWFAVAAIPWIGGLFTADVGLRLACWMVALAIEYSGPMAFFWVPGIGRSGPSDWVISGTHMAERCALFIIIALGEGLVMIGATYATAEAAPGIGWALLAAFAGSFAMWWIYFDLGARRGAEHIATHTNPGLIARQAFTYWHIPIVAGIIVLAVADELVLAHPLEATQADFTLILAVGMTLFLWGTMTFKKISSGRPWYPLSHAVGLWLTLLLALASLVFHPSRLALSVGGTLVFAVVALWEWVSFHGGWIERMERRDWRIGHALRRYSNRRRARREARASQRG